MKSINGEVLDKDKKIALKYLPISKYIQNGKVLIKTSLANVNLYLVGSKEDTLLKTF